MSTDKGILFLVFGGSEEVEEHRRCQKRHFPGEHFVVVDKIDEICRIIGRSMLDFSCICLILDMRCIECPKNEEISSIFCEMGQRLSEANIAFRMIIFTNYSGTIYMSEEDDEVYNKIVLGRESLSWMETATAWESWKYLNSGRHEGGIFRYVYPTTC